MSKAENGGAFRRFVFMGKTPHEIYRYFINFTYPNVCPCCDEIIDYDDDFCDECRNEIILYNGDFKVDNADYFTAYCMYEGKIKRAVRIFKREPRGNAYYAFAFGIVQALRRRCLTSFVDEIVYIPMSKQAYKRRGYNQCRLIAREIHYLLEKPVNNSLVKVKETKAQKALSGSERRENVKDAFSVNEKGGSVKGKSILLIDDLCTTGSTLSEAARVLKEAGAKTVIAASFAKTKDL